MCIFRPQGAGNVPRSHSTIESGVVPATGARRRFAPEEIARSAQKCCKSPPAGKIFIDFHANVPMTGKRQLSNIATP
jgi:hypothetical protein